MILDSEKLNPQYNQNCVNNASDCLGVSVPLSTGLLCIGLPICSVVHHCTILAYETLTAKLPVISLKICFAIFTLAMFCIQPAYLPIFALVTSKN